MYNPFINRFLLASVFALLDALKRGVRVTILTNSAESVDEPIVSAPILGSFNLHPRSIRYEWEIAQNVLDARFAADLDRAFQADIARAQACCKIYGLRP